MITSLVDERLAFPVCYVISQFPKLRAHIMPEEQMAVIAAWHPVIVNPSCDFWAPVQCNAAAVQEPSTRRSPRDTLAPGTESRPEKPGKRDRRKYGRERRARAERDTGAGTKGPRPRRGADARPRGGPDTRRPGHGQQAGAPPALRAGGDKTASPTARSAGGEERDVVNIPCSGPGALIFGQ